MLSFCGALNPKINIRKSVKSSLSLTDLLLLILHIGKKCLTEIFTALFCRFKCGRWLVCPKI